MSTETLPTNAPDFADIGRKAWNHLEGGLKELAKWEAKAIYVFVQAYNTTLFETVVSSANKEDGDYVLSFGLDTFTEEYEGSSNAVKGAMLNAITQKLFGAVIDMTESNKNKRTKMLETLKTAILLCEKLDDPAQVKLHAGRDLVVPYTVTHAAPGEGAKQSEINRYNALASTECVLDKTHGEDSLAALRKAVKPVQTRGTQAPKVATFTPPVTVTREARVDALAFALGKPALAEAVMKRIEQFEGIESLERWARVD